MNVHQVIYYIYKEYELLLKFHIIKKLDLSTLSTLLSTLEPLKGSFLKHAQAQTKKLCAYKKKKV